MQPVIALLAVSALWQGTVIVDGMIYEPGGYHPYKTTINLRLRESERVAVAGGFRVPLASDGSVYEVVTSVHQTDGPKLCSDTGTETLSGRRSATWRRKAGSRHTTSRCRERSARSRAAGTARPGPTGS